MQSFHDTLNKNLWNKEELKPEVAKKLKEIAKAFIEFLEVPEEAIRDVVITGSCASYNYTPQSDIDLHLLVDFDKVHKDCPIVGNYLLSKKSEFNNNHDIFIYGIPVEVYAESIDNENVHNGLYSIKNDKWIDKPQKLKPVDNDVAVNAKYKEFEEAVQLNDMDKMEDEMGDIFFATVTLARWYKIDAEQALLRANKKFTKRFKKMEEIAEKPLENYSYEEFDALWKRAKRLT